MLTLFLKVSSPISVPRILANQPCIVEGGGLRRVPSARNLYTSLVNNNQGKTKDQDSLMMPIQSSWYTIRW